MCVFLLVYLVHLELTCALNVDNFLLAFRRFVGRGGLPLTLISDNAKTFRSSIQMISHSSEVQRYLTNQRIRNLFLPELHGGEDFGSVW